MQPHSPSRQTADRSPVAGRTARTRPRIASATAGLIALIALVTLAGACSSSESHTAASSPGGSSSGSATTASSQPVASQAAYSGTNGTPPASGPRAVKGKSVWVISCGQMTPCAIQAQAVTQAAQTLGWTVKVCDGNIDMNNAYVTCMDQALAAQANGIITVAIDCSVIKAALISAKSAHVPVVNIDGFDCDQNLPSPDGPGLFAATVIPSTTYPTVGAFATALSTEEANWLITQTHGKARLINFALTSNTYGILNNDAIEAAFKSCSGCSLYEVPITFNDQTPTQLATLFQSSALRYPQANSFQVFQAAIMENGITNPLRTSSRKFVTVSSGPEAAAMDLVRQGVLDADVTPDNMWWGYAGADTLNRVFAGQPAVPEGIGFQIVDATHNLPASGIYRYNETDFIAAYDKIWTGS